MKEGVEDLEFVEYREYYDEYSFSSYDGYPLAVMRYCPYCGNEIQSLRPFLSVIQPRSNTFCGLDVMEPGFVFDNEAGKQRIVEHCLSHETKSKVLRENGLETPAELEVFAPLFQTLLKQKGRYSAIVTGDDAKYLEYIGSMADFTEVDATPRSRYYFLGFQAKRLESNLF